MDSVFEQTIRLRAYEMWIGSGRVDGKADQHWFDAERAVRKEADMTSVASAPRVARPASKAKKATGSMSATASAERVEPTKGRAGSGAKPIVAAKTATKAAAVNAKPAIKTRAAAASRSLEARP